MNIAIIFLISFVTWAMTRAFTWPLPELFRRAFWVIVLGLLIIPQFIGRSHLALANGVIWPLAAGLAVAEVAVYTFRDRREKWRAHRAERMAKREKRNAQLAAEAAKVAKAERRSRLD